MTMEQLTIFDAFEEQDRESKEPVFSVGDRVKIADCKELQGLSIEDEYVLGLHKGKKGTVVSIHYGKVTTYEVELGGAEPTRSYFYGKELIYLG